MPEIQVEFMGATITESSTVKNLGVIFDRSMTFSAHVSDVVRRCTGLLSGLSHSRHALPQNTLITIVQSLVLSAIRYCISVYGVCGITQTARLQKLLNFGARVISRPSLAISSAFRLANAGCSFLKSSILSKTALTTV